MSYSTGSSEPVRARLPTGSSLIDNAQEITLQAALNHAIGLVADCFDDCNRDAESESVYSQQAKAYEEIYAEVDDHQTTLVHTQNLAKNLVHGGLDYLKSATAATLNTGSVARWSALSLTRSLIEASADCLWLVDPKLNLDTRVRRTNQMFVRSCDEMLRMLPDRESTTSRFLSIDPAAKTVCLKARDSALEWAKAQGWACANGKAITRKTWIGEIPSHKAMVALAAEGEPDYWMDVYSMLSGATHSQPLLMTLSLGDEPDTHLDRALMVLDIGVSFYTDALRRLAEFMGWRDHDIDKWFAPVHLAIQHIRTPDDIPLPKFEIEGCEACPDYQEPFMHRLAFVSHLCALMELNVDPGNTSGTDAPERYSSAIEFFNLVHERLEVEDMRDPQTQEKRTALGVGHTGVLTLYGSNLREVLTSVAASWAVLRSPSYQTSVRKLQCWLSQAEDGSEVPYGNA